MLEKVKNKDILEDEKIINWWDEDVEFWYRAYKLWFKIDFDKSNPDGEWYRGSSYRSVKYLQFGIESQLGCHKSSFHRG